MNPNNHALDGGRASSAMEKECVARLGRLFGWDEALGHLTGGGTMANLEALWVAGRLHPGKRILASEQAHYTHARISDVLGLPFREVRVTDEGRMDVAHAEELVAAGDVGTLVATLGTTGLGAVDPLPELLELAGRYGVRVHADAAYGGYFGLASGLATPAREAFDALERVDSIVIDPHKHGLQPYGCGCVLFRDPGVGRIYKHDSPYTYFSSADLHLGEISLECSRPGAAAVALWATMERYPLEAGGEFAAMLDRCLDGAQAMHARLDDSAAYHALLKPELDIVVFAPAVDTASATSARSRAIFEAAANRDLHLALISLPAALVGRWIPGLDTDTDTVTCLRSVLMKPEHRAWVDRIVAILEAV
jgi:glutamate/tyrosine decarboxylase-like PLP-dependent enzyme